MEKTDTFCCEVFSDIPNVFFANVSIIVVLGTLRLVKKGLFSQLCSLQHLDHPRFHLFSVNDFVVLIFLVFSSVNLQTEKLATDTWNDQNTVIAQFPSDPVNLVD